MSGHSSASSHVPTLHVLAIGGVHQFAHFLPVAFALARRATCHVRIFVPDAADIAEIEHMASGLGYPAPQAAVMALPPTLGGLVPGKARKLAGLLAWAGVIRSGDALLCAERTSTLLKRLPGKCPPMIHIPHGAGDRAVGFEKRIALFDKVIVAGPKDRDRLVAEGVARPENCAVAGPVKVAAMLRMHEGRPALFEDDRPVLLYNPHFQKALSSAECFTRRLAEAVYSDGRYNLVIAPHVRMARQWSEAQRREWAGMAVPGRIIVDLGSRRSIDMSYTLGADLYIGDVSSQVYEFLIRPRPCLFVNSHRAAWERSEDYAMWRFGEVVRPDCDIIAALDRAFARHAEFVAAQVERTCAALDGLEWAQDGRPRLCAADPAERGADIVEAFFAERRPVPAAGREPALAAGCAS